MSYSANDNQNFFVQNGRTTSRVVAQPGGSCSISLGGWTPEELERQRQLREQRQAGNQQPPKKEAAPVSAKEAAPVVDEKENVVENTKPEVAPVEESVQKPAAAASAPAPQDVSRDGVVSSNAFASSSSTNSFNVITDRPTSRVSRPPGGHCSIRLG